jgi:hypothetical protein
MATKEIDREREMLDLAERLFFEVEKENGLYSFRRDVDVPEPVKRENLTLTEAEELLSTWQMKGEHGG